MTLDEPYHGMRMEKQRVSMILVADIGNTETVMGLYNGSDLVTTLRLSSKTTRTSDECWLTTREWLSYKEQDPEQIRGGAVCSVVPNLTPVFSMMMKKYMHVDPMEVDAGADTGIRILYDTPATVGADRICNAVAGFAGFGGPLIVVDFGTATTFDVISRKGDYLGGIIALGIMGASQELHRLAAKLPRVPLVFPKKTVGSNTENSMQSGITWGTICMVDGMVERILKEMGWRHAKVIATGGLAGMIADRSRCIEKVEPNLTLEGIRLIYERFCKKEERG